jgi:uncharacterized protein with NRDE domain
MCLLVFAYRQHPNYELVVCANRDEAYDRASSPARYWEDAPQVLAGRDLEKGGTWMGISSTGRFAALTNFRDPAQRDPSAPSRGLIVSDFLRGAEPAQPYLAELAPRSRGYNDFNLFLRDATGCFYFSSRSGNVVKLGPGLYGISNELLDVPWPKVVRAKAALAKTLRETDWIEPEQLLSLLADRSLPDDAALPDTGVGLEWERVLAPAFIVAPHYGTRASTVLLIEYNGRATFVERSYAPEGLASGTASYALVLDRSEMPA